MSISDPLTLLRDFTTSGRNVQLLENHIVFGSTRFERSAPSAYREARKKGSYYPIDALCFFLQNHDKPHAEYVGLCGKEKVKPVTLTDRKALYEYLTGIIDTTPSIDIEGVPAVQPVRAAGSEKLSDDYGKGEQAAGDMEMEEAVEDEEAVAEKRARAAEQARETAARVAEAKTAFAKIIDAPGDAQAEPSADGDEPGSQAAKAANAEKPMHAARAFLKADYSVTKAIVKRELRMRTRQSVLLAPVASTFPVVTQILEGFRKKNAALLEVEARRARHGHPPPAAHAHAPHAHAPYVRAPQPADAASGRPPMAAPRPAHGLKPGLKPGAKPGRGPGIIIVPQSLTSVVNMWNAQQLLKDKRYVPPLEVKQSGETKPAYVKLLHQFEDGTQASPRGIPVPPAAMRRPRLKARGQFLITDAPLKLSKAEWDQVVCVFVQGVTWQFKDWPFESEVELFTKVLGVYLRFQDELKNQTVKAWRVQELLLSKQRTKQHEIGVTTMLFWQAMHKHIACHKPHLLIKPVHH